MQMQEAGGNSFVQTECDVIKSECSARRSRPQLPLFVSNLCFYLSALFPSFSPTSHSLTAHSGFSSGDCR